MGSACFRELADSRAPLFNELADSDASAESTWCAQDLSCCPALPRDSSVQSLNVLAMGSTSIRPQGPAARNPQLEAQIQELFRLHDLNANGVLEEEELVQLNAKVALLHYGRDVDMAAVKEKYRRLFREKLDPQGRPVPYAVFRRYVLTVLDGLDTDPVAQEMIVEQFAAEAKSARAVFHAPSFASSSDQSFTSKISFQSLANFPSRERYPPSPDPRRTSPAPKESVAMSPAQPGIKTVYPASRMAPAGQAAYGGA
mmetsp:Transcript_25124/g.66448  ORF Transcript_25124/g.66448 Transcript_25124/m.66448 type:complete len:256 (-) Transcript_25124:50-817(-)